MKRITLVLAGVALLLAATVLWLTKGTAQSPSANTAGAKTEARDNSDLATSGLPAKSGKPDAGPGMSVAASEDTFSPEADAARAAELAARARDTNLDPAERLEAMRELVQMGGRPAVEQLLMTAKDLFVANETTPFAADVAGQIAELTTPASVEVMGEILTDRHPSFGSFDNLPVTLRDAITSGLRKNPDPMLVAKSLSVQFDAVRGNVRAQSRIEMLEHPETTSRLAERAQAASDTPLLQERLAMLQTTRDARVYDTVVRLAQDGNIPRQNLDEVILNWASRRPESVDFQRLLATAADTSGTYDQRAYAALGIAAYAQSTPQVRDLVTEALNKPLADQALDGRVRQSFQQALALLNR